jgi:nucleotide-binding universal stress UspA family protein
MDIGRIVVPYDFSQYARAALDAALELADQFDAELHLVHVVQTPAFGYGSELATSPLLFTEGYEAARERLDEVAASLEPSWRVESHAVEGGPVAAAIDAFAERIEADLIVMGTHGRRGLAHALVGSVAERTLRGAPCAVLTIRTSPQRPQPAPQPAPKDGVSSYSF